MKRIAAALSLALLLVLLLGYLAYVARQIARQSTVDEARSADVILVLGAAEYRGKPSPVLQARLNHALLLYLKNYAPYILTTGGAGGDPRFTEADVARAYLIEHGVPSEDILTDAEGSTTAQSVDGAAEIMHRMNLNSCIVVSDGYHIYRVKRFLEAHQIRVFGSPRPASKSLTPRQARWLYLRQAVGFVLWQLGINL
jgi:vancomycin permeability regulator SanA